MLEAFFIFKQTDTIDKSITYEFMSLPAQVKYLQRPKMGKKWLNSGFLLARLNTKIIFVLYLVISRAGWVEEMECCVAPEQGTVPPIVPVKRLSS